MPAGRVQSWKKLQVGGGVERISSKHFSLTTKIIVKRHFLVKWINYFFNSFQKWVDVINFSFFLQ